MNNKDKLEIVDILKNLVAIDSAYPPGNSTKINNYIFNYLKSAKLNLSLKGPHKDKLSLIVKNFKGNQKSIIFNSHIPKFNSINQILNRSFHIPISINGITKNIHPPTV